MPTPSGQIALSQVNTELGNSSTAQINMNNVSLRSLAGVPSGQISMSNLQGKSLAGSVSFDGTSFLSLTDSSSFDLGLSNQPFTIECWTKFSTNSDGMVGLLRGGGFGGWQGTTGHQYTAFSYPNNLIFWQSWTGGGRLDLSTGNNVVTTNTWYHIAFCYDGSTMRTFINGTQQASASTSFGKPSNSSITRIGRSAANDPTSATTVSNLRVVKGTALYTSNFSVPTSPLTNVTNTILLCCQSRNSATEAAVKPSGVTISTSGTVTAGSDNPF